MLPGSWSVLIDGSGSAVFGRMEPGAGVGPRGHFHAQTHRKILIFLVPVPAGFVSHARDGTQARL